MEQSEQLPSQPEDASPPFDKIVRTTLKSVRLWAIYLGAIFALVVAYNKFGSDLGIKSHLAIFALGGIPLFVTLSTHTLPRLINRRRQRRVIDFADRGVIKKPGYFRLTPYQREEHEDFKRADHAHEAVLNWLLTSTSSLLYLSGASGTGKSSLLNAYVLPKLESPKHRFTTIAVRSFHDPVQALADALRRSGNVWKSKPPTTEEARSLLEQASAYLEPQRLLIVLDQFEEFLILHDEEARQELENLLRSLVNDPIPRLTVLLTLRSEYLGELDDDALPTIEKGSTWTQISPFNLRTSQQFLDESGLELTPQLRYQVLTEATSVEETQGLIRPITLNMFGVILERFAGRLPKDVEPGALLTGYVRQAITHRDIQHEAADILREMMTNGGTKVPRSEEQLVKATGHRVKLIRGALLTLANEGIVRRIDDTARIWEISHDFVAGLLKQILLKRTLSGNIRFTPWLAPVALVLWFVTVLTVVPLYQEWRHRGALQEFNEMAIGQVTLSNQPESPRYTVTIKQPVSDALLSSVVNLLSKLKYPIYSLNLISAAGLTDLTPLTRLRTLQEFRLGSMQELTNLTPLARLHNLQVLQLVGVVKLTDLTPLARLHKLSQLELHDAKQLTDLTPLVGLYNLQELILEGAVGLMDLTPLTGLSNLSRLSFHHAEGLTDLAPLAGLVNLQELNLGHAKEILNLTPLAGLRNLRKLYSSGKGLIDLTPLAALYNLQELGLEGEEGLADLTPLRGLYNLQELGLEGAKEITDLTPLAALRNLRILNLGSAKRLTDLTPLAGLHNLRMLYLSDEAGISKEQIVELTNTLPGLHIQRVKKK